MSNTIIYLVEIFALMNENRSETEFN
jgi:hypothetical protein